MPRESTANNGIVDSKLANRHTGAAAVQKTQEITVVRSMVVAGNRFEMTGRPATFKACGWLASSDPGVAIGFRPQVERQGAWCALG